MSEPRIVSIDDSDLAKPEASVRDKLAFLLSCSTDGHFTAEHFLNGAEVAIIGDDMIRISLRNVNDDGEICDEPPDCGKLLSEESEWDIVLLRRTSDSSAHPIQRMWENKPG